MCDCLSKLDGVEVILFGSYVYEHDEKNLEPNKRAVYVSYLDSVHYMKPRKMRTFIMKFSSRILIMFVQRALPLPTFGHVLLLKR